MRVPSYTWLVPPSNEAPDTYLYYRQTLGKEVIFLHLKKLQYVSIALYSLYIIQSSEAELITWGFKIYSRELTTKVSKDSIWCCVT